MAEPSISRLEPGRVSNYVIFADAAERTEGGKLALLGGNLDVLRVPTFPIVVPSLVAVISLTVDASECKVPHTARIELVHPRGENLLPLSESTFTPHPNPEDTSALPIRYLFLASLNGLLLPGPGQYALRVIIDGAQVGGNIPRLVLEARATPASVAR